MPAGKSQRDAGRTEADKALKGRLTVALDTVSDTSTRGLVKRIKALPTFEFLKLLKLLANIPEGPYDD